MVCKPAKELYPDVKVNDQGLLDVNWGTTEWPFCGMPSPFHVPACEYAGLGLEPQVLPDGMQPPEISGYVTRAAMVVTCGCGDINSKTSVTIAKIGGLDVPPRAIQVQPTKLFDEADAFCLLFVGYDASSGTQKCLWSVVNSQVEHDRTHFAPVSCRDLVSKGTEVKGYTAPSASGLPDGAWYMYLVFVGAPVDVAAATQSADAQDFTVGAFAAAHNLGKPICGHPFKLNVEAWTPDAEPTAPE